MKQLEQDLDGSLIENDNERDSDLLTTEEEMKSEKGVRNSIERVRNAVERLAKKTNDVGETRKFVIRAIQGVLNGQETTVREQGEHTMNGIEDTGIETTRTPERGAIAMTRPSSLAQRLDSLELAGSESMSLLDSSAKQLHGAMQKLLDDKTQNPERISPIDTDKVNSAVKCADQIAKLMKVKLEAYKVLGPKK